MRLKSFGRYGLAAALISLASVISAPAMAQQLAPRPELLTRLAACRDIVDPTQRLGCYDTAAGALDSAERQGDVVLVDRAQVSATRRQLFGFQVPKISLFEGGLKAEPVEAIETTLTRAGQGGDGKWVFTLGDESVWRQIDSEPVSFTNRAGQAVRVRRASLGSYLLTVDRSRAVRVRRQ